MTAKEAPALLTMLDKPPLLGWRYLGIKTVEDLPMVRLATPGGLRFLYGTPELRTLIERQHDSFERANPELLLAYSNLQSWKTESSKFNDDPFVGYSYDLPWTRSITVVPDERIAALAKLVAEERDLWGSDAA
jgi:hypothetical protein